MEGYENEDRYFDHTGVVYDGKGMDDRGHGVKKLAYFTYKLMGEKLEGSDWNNIATINTHLPNVYAYQFKKRVGDAKVVVLWWDWFAELQDPANGSRVVALPWDRGPAVVTRSITDREGRRVTSNLTPRGGVLEVPVSADPVFVEGD